jgi:bacterioferritin-associated ferredoxin
MIVCPCDEIDDATIRQLVRQGATRIEQIALEGRGNKGSGGVSFDC